MGIWDIFKRKNNDFKTLDYAELDKMFETAYLKGLAIDNALSFWQGFSLHQNLFIREIIKL